MNSVLYMISKLNLDPKAPHTNLRYCGQYHFQPRAPVPNLHTVEAHQRIVGHAIRQYLYPHESEHIFMNYRRSLATDESIYDDFFAGDIPPHSVPKDEHYLFGLQYTLDAFRPPTKCRPAHIFDVKEHYPFKWTVNAEPPFSTDKRFLNMLEPGTPAKFGVLKHEVFKHTRAWHHIIKDNPHRGNELRWPMLLHTKTAIVKFDDPNKMRTIWGYPKPALIAEVMFFWEYLAWIKRNPGRTPMLWGYETLTGGWFRLNAELHSSFLRSSIFTLDWKRFDKKALFTVIRDLMQGVTDYIDFEHGYVPTSNYPDTESEWNPHKAQRLRNLWNWTVENIFKSKIVLPDGSLWERLFAGIPSGLYITQLLDSLYNTLMLVVILHSLGLPINEHTVIKVQGDDSIIRLMYLVPPNAHTALLQAMQDKADYYFQSVISLDKSEIRPSPVGSEVLGYRNLRGLPYRDCFELLASFYYTKAKSPTPETTMAQAIGIAYASLGNDRRVYDICLDIYNYYKEQGYTANPIGLNYVFESAGRPDSEINLLGITTERFPTICEIQRFLLCYDYDRSASNDNFWPPNHFLRII